jgi:hypothetical protein
MKVFKTYVNNWNKNKGCIAENYTMKESIKFCVGYEEFMEYIGSMPSRNQVWDDEEREVVHSGMVLFSETSIELDDISLL